MKRQWVQVPIWVVHFHIHPSSLYQPSILHLYIYYSLKVFTQHTTWFTGATTGPVWDTRDMLKMRAVFWFGKTNSRSKDIAARMISAEEEYKGDGEPSPPLPTPPLHLFHSPVGLPWWLGGKESTCNAGDVGLVPGLGRSSGEGNGSPLQCSCLENPMDGGTWLQSLGWQRIRYNWAACSRPIPVKHLP